MRRHPQQGPRPVRIPADVERDDPILAGLAVRQLIILTAVAAALYGGWLALQTRVTPLAYVGVALPVLAVTLVVVVARRDGISLDRWLTAAVRQRLAPRLHVNAPEGTGPAPEWITAQAATHDHGRFAQTAEAIGVAQVGGAAGDRPGVVDLGADGCAVVAAASTVNLALRTPSEQEMLVAAFGRYLHSLTGPTQILVRTSRLDLTGQITALRERAPGLPHPALRAAAAEHADYLAELAETTDLLCRQVLLVLREPTRPSDPGNRSRRGRLDSAGNSADGMVARLVRRAEEAAALLHPAGITVTALDADQASAVLAAACNPDSRIRPGAVLAPSGTTITSGAGTGPGRSAGQPAGWSA